MVDRRGLGVGPRIDEREAAGVGADERLAREQQLEVHRVEADLEAIEVNIFRGRSPDENRQRVFGGQVAKH